MLHEPPRLQPLYQLDRTLPGTRSVVQQSRHVSDMLSFALHFASVSSWWHNAIQRRTYSTAILQVAQAAAHCVQGLHCLAQAPQLCCKLRAMHNLPALTLRLFHRACWRRCRTAMSTRAAGFRSMSLRTSVPAKLLITDTAGAPLSSSSLATCGVARWHVIILHCGSGHRSQHWLQPRLRWHVRGMATLSATATLCQCHQAHACATSNTAYIESAATVRRAGASASLSSAARSATAPAPLCMWPGTCGRTQLWS